MQNFFGLTNTKEKNHYFIGNIFDDEILIRTLRYVQKKIKNKYSLKNYHINNKFFSNLIYLGYLDNETVNLYMSNILNPLLNSLSSKIETLQCNFTGYKLENDKSFYKISLKFEDKDNYLEKIIIPYLHQNAITPFYEKKNMLKPAIDLIYYKESYKIKDKNSIKIEVPKNNFTVDHISLIKGTPVKARTGTPSTHDQMTLEEVSRYKFPLKHF